MKSQLFSKNDLSEGRFVQDMKYVASLPRDVLQSLPDLALRAHFATTRTDRTDVEKLCEATAQTLQVSRWQLDRSMNVLRFLLRELAPEGDANADDPNLLVEDILGVCELPPEMTEPLTDLLRRLKELATEEVRLAALRESQSLEFLPTLESIATTADFRAVFAKQYNYEEDLASYSPACIDLIPVGIVRLTFNDDQDSVFFQVNKRTLEIMMDSLVALRRKIETAEACVSYKKPV